MSHEDLARDMFLFLYIGEYIGSSGPRKTRRLLAGPFGSCPGPKDFCLTGDDSQSRQGDNPRRTVLARLLGRSASSGHETGPRRAVLPRLGPLPKRMWIVWLLLGLSAWIVLLPASAAPWSWVPAAQASPDEAHAMNLHWLVHQQGVFAASHSRLLYYPTGMNWLAACGIPLDALASWPLLALAGWPAGFTLFLVLLIWGAGAAMAWLAGCWWRSAGAGLVAGVAYQCSGILLWEVAGGRTANLLGAIFIPLALGLLARGLLANRWQDGLLAGVMTGLAVKPVGGNGPGRAHPRSSNQPGSRRGQQRQRAVLSEAQEHGYPG